MTRLKVGVIGCGTVAQIMHLPHLHDLEDRYQISALSDLSPGLLAYLSGRYNVPPKRCYTDYRDLLSSDLDAVLVLTSGSHGSPVLAALAAGKHIFVEKPLCFTLREANEIENAVRKSSLICMIAYMKRYDPGYLYAQGKIKNLPSIRYIQINTLHPSEDQYWNIHNIKRFRDVPEDALKPLIDKQEALLDEAVGPIAPNLRKIYHDVILGSMVHDINALRGLVSGRFEVIFTEIWPEGGTFPGITTMLRHESGFRVVYTWVYLAKLRDYFEEIAIMSSESRVRIQFPSPFLKQFPTPVVIQGMDGEAMLSTHVTASYDEAFRNELIAFHDSVVNGRPPLTDVADGKADIEILQRVLAAYNPPGLAGEVASSRGRMT